jgi:hypothetical protein
LHSLAVVVANVGRTGIGIRNGLKAVVVIDAKGG